MRNHDDTICAIATAPGTGAIAVLRLSGPQAWPIAESVFQPASGKPLPARRANRLHFGRLVRGQETLDEVVVGWFRGPRSYTGQDVVEISCHGSPYLQQKALELLLDRGARLARPGEFTQRAFLNGKMDLSQAEAVADLIASTGEAARRLAMDQMRGGFSRKINELRQRMLAFTSLVELELDFSEEDVEFADRAQLDLLLGGIASLLRGLVESFSHGNAVKNGIPVAIVGQPNVGKSTLLNRLLDDDKAIVSEIAGTTRDLIEDTAILAGRSFRFIDTAGIRETTDLVEAIGIQRTHKTIEKAKIVLLVVDARDSLRHIGKTVQRFKKANDMAHKHLVVVANKADMLSSLERDLVFRHNIPSFDPKDHLLALSAREDADLLALRALLVELSNLHGQGQNEVVVTNARHYEALTRAEKAIARAQEAIAARTPTDLLAQDIREALHFLGEITGEITNDQILANIFANFCIGK